MAKTSQVNIRLDEKTRSFLRKVGGGDLSQGLRNLVKKEMGDFKGCAWRISSLDRKLVKFLYEEDEDTVLPFLKANLNESFIISYFEVEVQ